MLPVWPNTNAIPLWVWLLAVVGFIGIGLWVSTPDFDADLAMHRVRQGIAFGIIVVGLLWSWWGGRVLLQLRALDERGVVTRADGLRLWSSSQVVRTSGPISSRTSVTTQCFLAYRFEHPGGKAHCRRMRVDDALWQSLRDVQEMPVRYLPDRPSVSRPEALALPPVWFLRGFQLAAGLALVGWSVFALSPGTLW